MSDKLEKCVCGESKQDIRYFYSKNTPMLICEKDERSKHGYKIGEFKCVCGKHFNAIISDVKRGHTKSCGCYARLIQTNGMLNNTNGVKHGLSRSRIKTTWNNMNARCYNKKADNFIRYGGRGICIEFKSFMDFVEWSFSNGYNDNLTIDRIDNDGNYSPENCRWVTSREQYKNRRRNVNLTFNKETRNLSSWARFFGVGVGRVRRLHSLFQGDEIQLEIIKMLAKEKAMSEVLYG